MFRSLKVGLGMFALVGTMALLAATTDGAPTPKKNTKSKVKPADSQPVSVVEYAFQPQTKVVNAGDSVSWKNIGQEPHTVTANDGSFDFVLQPGDTTPPVVINKTTDYYCRYHRSMGMTGTIQVGNSPQAKKAAAKKAANKAPAKKAANKAPAKKAPKAPKKKVPAKKHPKDKE